MSEWLSNSLGELVTFQKGRKVATSPYPLENYAAYLGASRLSGASEGYGSKFLAVTADEHDVLMLWDGERSGLCRTGLSGVVSSTVAKLTPSDSINSFLLYYLLLYNFQWIQNRRTGTGVPHVPKDLGKILRLTYPKSKYEQQKIARILQIIDKAIEKTEALIGKYQQIKAGLMNDLFTRGIGPDDKLRPPRDQAPELYQETPIGWIPKEWKLRAISELAAPYKGSTVIGPFGSDLVMSDYQTEGVPVVFVRDVKESGFKWVSNVFVSERKAQRLFSHRVSGEDVLATKMGFPPCVSAVYPSGMPMGIITADMIRMTVDTDKVDAHWLSLTINHDRVKRQVAAITAGVTRAKVTLSDFRRLNIAMPPLNEQREIKAILGRHAKLLDSEKRRKEKLQKQKSGLMHDLLTGKVSVQVDRELKAEAADV